MVNETNEGLHHNHRARMREKLFEHGVETFHDHELLEMLLYACESRRNTNDTAHALLNRFGSLNGVFTATPEALSTVPGIKDAATALIAVARELMKRVENERTVVPNRFESREQMYEYILRLFKFSAVEELYMLMFDADDRFIDCELINRGTTQSVQMDTRKMVEEATKRKAETVVLAHNHPKGKLIASSEDILLTRDVTSTFNNIGIQVTDHVIVANNKYVSIMSSIYGL